MIEIDGFTKYEADPEKLSVFQKYFREYYNDQFYFGQGTEEMLENLNRYAPYGHWLDLGSGPSTLFWSIPLNGVKSISSCDIAIEALLVLQDFVRSDLIPNCYKQVLEMFGKTDRHLAEMRASFSKYMVFDTMKPWPTELSSERYDLITAFGNFGLAKKEGYMDCFTYVSEHLIELGKVIGCDWIRNPAFIKQDGHDNSYLHQSLTVESGEKAGLKILDCRLIDIKDDPLYDAVIVWAMEKAK